MIAEKIRNLMHVLFFILILNMCWMFFVEIYASPLIDPKMILYWLMLYFVAPLTVMNFHYEEKFFAIGSLLYALFYSLLIMGKLTLIEELACCTTPTLILSILSLIGSMVMIVISVRIVIHLWRERVRS